MGLQGKMRERELVIISAWGTVCDYVVFY